MAERVTTPLLVLITAPSGAGKTTVSKMLLDTTPRLERAITCTTRVPRRGEKDGHDYYFLSREVFDRRVAAGDFLEHAEVYGNRYGTLRDEVLRRLAAGSDVLLSVDVQGAEALRGLAAADRKISESLVSVFLLPPSVAELERRLTGRNQDSAESVARRLSLAREEMEHWRHFDYVLVSGSMESDLEAMRGVLASERLRSARVRRLRID